MNWFKWKTKKKVHINIYLIYLTLFAKYNEFYNPSFCFWLSSKKINKLIIFSINHYFKLEYNKFILNYNISIFRTNFEKWIRPNIIFFLIYFYFLFVDHRNIINKINNKFEKFKKLFDTKLITFRKRDQIRYIFISIFFKLTIFFKHIFYLLQDIFCTMKLL